MSLFSSSFDTTAGAGPSFSSSARPTNSQKKRKRPSLNDGVDKNGQIRSTTANLQKLMKKVESSKSLDRPREQEGRESMGSISKKAGKKAKNGPVNDEDEEDNGFDNEELPTPKQKPVAKGKNVDSPAPVGKKSKYDKKDKESTPKKDVSTPKKGGSGLEPAELPLPHTIRHEDTGESEGLTKMQRDMKAKLEGARFRWINEQLYSTPSTDAVAMMQKDPKIFSDYHLTHRALTSAWPSPPLPHIISLLSPLPARTVIADLGCGDAGLAKALVPEGKIVLSYDLVGDRGNVGGGKGEGWVVESDFLSSVPLPGRVGGSSCSPSLGSESAGAEKKSKRSRGKKGTGNGDEASEVVDVVVCCLSLMGTNWIGGIYEACRILKQGGTFHIAEVTSRFVSTESFTSQVESFGFELQSESSPSTHFTLFEFTKLDAVPQGAVKGEKGWEGRINAGSEILRACVYKKR